MGYLEEFRTVDLVLDSQATTRGVDAFALSLIKLERQMRRLVTHLVYQSPCFGQSHKAGIRKALAENSRVYFEGFEKGFDAIYPRAIHELVGSRYTHLRSRICEATKYRGKIFHGQLTSMMLGTDDLVGFVNDMKEWCNALAREATAELEYDGFTSSLRKSQVKDLATRYRRKFSSLNDYKQFVASVMQRPHRRR